jgi:hypothetical protein
MPLVRYLFSVMRDDSSRLVQRRLAGSVLESLPILAAVQDLAPPDPGAEDSKDEKKRDELANVLKALRKKPGRSMNYRTSLLTTLTYVTFSLLASLLPLLTSLPPQSCRHRPRSPSLLSQDLRGDRAS